SYSAAWSTTSTRAVLMKYDPGRRAASTPRSIRLHVPLVSAMWMVKAGVARLRHLQQGGAHPEDVPQAGRVLRQPFQREVLPELSGAEVVAALAPATTGRW